jgi:PhnB protein
VASIAPWLSVRSAAEAVAFYVAAFGAVERERLEDDAGELVVALLSLDGAELWVSADPAAASASPADRPVRMILTVDDPDTVHARAVAAGATEVTPVGEGYGWRVGRVADPFGHHWEIGHRLPG